jgi:hypothetical protein
MYFEHYANMFQHNVNHNKTLLLGSIYSNRHPNPTLPSEFAKKSLVKRVHIDRTFTLNTEPFPLGLITVLSGRCHFSDLV